MKTLTPMKPTMKLGKDTANVFSWLRSAQTPLAPVVGEGATELHWTDRSAWEVLSVSKDGRECQIQRYRVQWDWDTEGYPKSMELVDGDPVVTLRWKYGQWMFKSEVEGKWIKMNIVFGVKDAYYDRTF